MKQTMSKKDLITYAAAATVRAINVHYPPPKHKTTHLITPHQFGKLIEDLYKRNMGRSMITPIELMF
jgi:hypothetical protein